MILLWLLPEIIKMLVHNRSKEYPQRLFEVNYVIQPDSGRDVQSKNVLTFSFVSAHEQATFTEAKQVVTYFFSLFNIPYSIEECEHASFIPGRVGALIVHKKKIGFLGELHPTVLEKWNLEVPCIGCEIDC